MGNSDSRPAQSASKQRNGLAPPSPASSSRAAQRAAPQNGVLTPGAARPVLPALNHSRSLPAARPVAAAAAGAAAIDLNADRTLARLQRELIVQQQKLLDSEEAHTILAEANETLQAEVLRLRQLLLSRGVVDYGPPVPGVDQLLRSSVSSSNESRSQESYPSVRYDAATIRRDVAQLFATKGRDLLGRRYDDPTAIGRVNALIESVPGPPLRLISWQTIKQLGRLPSYQECVRHGYTMSYKEFATQYAQRDFDIVYFSHVWFNSPDGDGVSADDAAHSKAAAIARLGSGSNVFWIDQCCLDPDAKEAGLEMLPLYIACCQIMFCYITPGYRHDAWTRLDRVLFASICAPDQNCFYAGGEQKIRETWETLADPRQGDVGTASERQQLVYLTELATTLWPRSHALGFDRLHEYAELPEITRTLEFGLSKVMIEEPDDADDDLEEASALFF